MSEPLNRHEPTGRPATSDATAELARTLVDSGPMSAADVMTLGLVHILGRELAAALNRIETLEKRLPAEKVEDYLGKAATGQ